MRYATYLSLLLLTVPATSAAQELFPRKDLAFAQIAAGKGYETVLNVTNRGTLPYSGTISFYRPSGTPWSVLVNNSPTTGTSPFSLATGATTSLRITLSDPNQGTQSGFALIRSSDNTRTSLLEGNLTYYVKSGNGGILDSVGLPPSGEIFQAVLPFDDFLSVALAFANINSASQTAHIRLTLYDENDRQIAVPATQNLSRNNQFSQYLYQYFPGVSLTRGRVEIQSDALVLGAALTSVAGVNGNQFSSLPFQSSTKAYSYTTNVSGAALTGEMYIGVDAPYVTGYLHNATTNGVLSSSGLDELTGVIQSGDLDLYFHGGRGTSAESITYIHIAGYDPAKNIQIGSIIVYFVSPARVSGIGTINFTAIN